MLDESGIYPGYIWDIFSDLSGIPRLGGKYVYVPAMQHQGQRGCMDERNEGANVMR
jgi:hypothetical protein